MNIDLEFIRSTNPRWESIRSDLFQRWSQENALSSSEIYLSDLEENLAILCQFFLYIKKPTDVLVHSFLMNDCFIVAIHALEKIYNSVSGSTATGALQKKIVEMLELQMQQILAADSKTCQELKDVILGMYFLALALKNQQHGLLPLEGVKYENLKAEPIYAEMIQFKSLADFVKTK